MRIEIPTEVIEAFLDQAVPWADRDDESMSLIDCLDHDSDAADHRHGFKHGVKWALEYLNELYEKEGR